MFDKATKTCKDFQRQVTELRKIYDKAVAFAEQNYQSDFQVQEIDKATKTFNESYRKVRQQYIEKATALLNDARSTIKRQIGTVNPVALQGIQALKGMKLSKTEIEALLDQNKKDYYSLRVIAGLAAENGFKVGTLPADDMSFTLDKLEDRLSAFASFDGTDTFRGHKVMEVSQLQEPFSDLENEFVKLNTGGLIEVHAEERKSDNTPEQMQIVKNLFENGGADKFAVADNLVKLGMTELITGTEYEIYLSEALKE